MIFMIKESTKITEPFKISISNYPGKLYNLIKIHIIYLYITIEV